MKGKDTIRDGRFVDAPALDRRQRWAVVVLVTLVHIALVALVVRGLGGVSAILSDVGLTSAYNIALDPPALEPSPAKPVPSSEPEGAEGAAGKKARATQIVAKPARIPVKTAPAAPAASTGNDTRSGATSAGSGTGGGAGGSGTGSGGNGSGAGGRALAERAVKVAGDITSTRDYPREGREDRAGKQVIVMLTVGTEGRVTGCSVYKASGDPQADATTCRLATERFRFRPALDQNGAPVVSTYGWQQRWFAP